MQSRLPSFNYNIIFHFQDGNSMKNYISPAVKMVGMAVFACFISFFVYISFYVMIREFSTTVVGYTVYEIDSEGNATDIETFKEAPESIKENQGYRQVRSEMPKAANIIMGSLQVICGVGVFFCVVGSVLAKQAAKDRNNMDFAGASYDKLKGLKIGAIAAIPSALLWAVALILRLMPKVAFVDTYYWVYRWVIMCPVKPIIDIFTNNAATLHAAPLYSVVLMGVVVVLFVAFCAAMYMICFNEDSVIAKILYKSTKNKKQETRRLSR